MMNSYWLETKKFPAFSPLEENLACDVCIVGGGITGITLAYLLTQNGKKVILLEKEELATSTTGNTTAKITSQHGLFYSYLIDSFGIDYAKSYLQANQNAIDEISAIIAKENINCNFERQDSYVFTEQLKEVDKIKQEQEAMEKLNFPSEYVTQTPLPLEIQAAIKFPNQAQFHVRKYLSGLIHCIVDKKGILYEHSKVTDVQKNGNSYLTFCNGHKISSHSVVIATKYPFINMPGFYFLKMYQSTSYAIAVETKSELFSGMYINEEQPTMSFRTIQDGNRKLLLIGGSDHKTGSKIDLENAYSSLEDIALKMYPDSNVLYRWNTEDCISVDKLPYVGTYSTLLPHMYVATGFKKWGMTTSYVAANILTDAILEKENPYSKLFDSSRFSPIKNSKEMGNMIKESAYSLVLNKMHTPDTILDTEDSLHSLSKEEGKIILLNGQKVGVYKDSNGTVYKVKPICSHLGCELSFNNLEKTWDCPCHGSRFDYQGNCLYGPSVQDIKFLGNTKE